MAHDELGWTTPLSEWELQLVDDFGDGWNGNTLSLSVNGVDIESFTISSGSSASDSFCVSGGNNWQLTFNTGSWSDEVSF